MFEASLITLLAADSDLQTLLASFEGAPAIFTGKAPQTATYPYMVIDITEYETGSMVVRYFDVAIDVFSRGDSYAAVRNICRRLKIVLEAAEIKTDTRYSTIRFYHRTIREVEESDTDILHYFYAVDARAGDIKTCEALAP